MYTRDMEDNGRKWSDAHRRMQNIAVRIHRGNNTITMVLGPAYARATLERDIMHNTRAQEGGGGSSCRGLDLIEGLKVIIPTKINKVFTCICLDTSIRIM